MQTAEKVKCVIWDLDNTIWHGILAENDQLVPRKDIQRIIAGLDQRGILQSVASKNEYGDAMQKISALGLEAYFLYPQINWGTKSESILFIREKLNIEFRSIVFIDDQAFERDEVLSVCPALRCWDVDVIENLLERQEMIPRFITAESGRRRLMYLQDEQRNLEEKLMNDNPEFLKSLGMKFTIARATEEDIRRVEELTLRTNQLNATGYSYSYNELLCFIHSPCHILLVCELEDKYGTYGKIGVALLEYNDAGCCILLLLMSCRVMSRGVGSALLGYIVNTFKVNATKLYAKFLHTGRNRIMYITYRFCGFETTEKMNDVEELLVHNGAGPYCYPPYLEIESPHAGMHV